MAKNLNKSRMLFSRIILLSLIIIGLFFTTPIRQVTAAHELMELIGYIMVIICALGRVYASVFIGGHKNDTLITWGPYSMMRNPLYFFSLVGITGIAIMALSIGATVIAFSLTLGLYLSLISREENYLKEKFGDEYRAYSEKTPSLWPSFKNYNCPETVVCCPKYVHKALLDAIWWFVPLPLFEVMDYILSVTDLKLPFVF